MNSRKIVAVYAMHTNEILMHSVRKK